MRNYLRTANEFAFRAAVISCGTLSVLSVILIFSGLIYKGAGRVDVQFLLSETLADGYSGGIFYQITGSLILIIAAAIVVVPVATAFALFQTQILRSGMIKKSFLVFLYVLNATPSILFGVLGFAFFVKRCGLEKSWLGGSFVLAAMILPTVTLALIERIQTIPSGYVETGRGLGLNDDSLIWAIILPYGWGGLLTGVVLGLARAAGETAPIMFTAAVFSGATLPTGVKDSPVLALPYHIFNLAQDAFSPEAMRSAWATALVLTVMVFMISVSVMPFRARSHEEAKA